MIGASLYDALSAKAVEVANMFQPANGRAESMALSVVDPVKRFGRFRTFVVSDGSTGGVLVAPDPGGSLLLTDLSVFTRRQSGRTFELLLTDGVRSEVLFDADLTNDAVTYSSNFAGRWQGWQNARIEYVTDTSLRFSVGIGYVKVPNAEEYEVWELGR